MAALLAALWLVAAAAPGARAPAGPAAQTDQAADETTRQADRPRKNAVLVSGVAQVPRFGLGVSYERAVSRRFAVLGRFDYHLQEPGWWHLQGMGETVGAQVWVTRFGRGFYAEATFGITHQFLAQQPRLGMTAIAPGVGVGFRWPVWRGLSIGATGGLRWGRVVQDSRLVCTHRRRCPAVREGAYARLTLDIGYAF